MTGTTNAVIAATFTSSATSSPDSHRPAMTSANANTAWIAVATVRRHAFVHVIRSFTSTPFRGYCITMTSPTVVSRFVNDWLRQGIPSPPEGDEFTIFAWVLVTMIVTGAPVVILIVTMWRDVRKARDEATQANDAINHRHKKAPANDGEPPPRAYDAILESRAVGQSNQRMLEDARRTLAAHSRALAELRQWKRRWEDLPPDLDSPADIAARHTALDGRITVLTNQIAAIHRLLAELRCLPEASAARDEVPGDDLPVGEQAP